MAQWAPRRARVSFRPFPLAGGVCPDARSDVRSLIMGVRGRGRPALNRMGGFPIALFVPRCVVLATRHIRERGGSFHS